MLPPHVYVLLNASPETIISGRLFELMKNAPWDRIIIEITEHDPIDDPVKLMKMMSELRRIRVRFAILARGIPALTRFYAYTLIL